MGVFARLNAYMGNFLLARSHGMSGESAPISVRLSQLGEWHAVDLGGLDYGDGSGGGFGAR
ncbi:hypothetical protein EB810_06270 [Altererythrobacter sp. FM1]|nr:hypothetical protein EB810_06270 [Altererythrobacter sp. FM1]